MNTPEQEVERLRAQMIKDVKFLTQKPGALPWDLSANLDALIAAVRASASTPTWQGTPSVEEAKKNIIERSGSTAGYRAKSLFRKVRARRLSLPGM